MYLCGRWVDVPVDFVPGQMPQLLGRDGAFDALFLVFVHTLTFLLGAPV